MFDYNTVGQSFAGENCVRKLRIVHTVSFNGSTFCEACKFVCASVARGGRECGST